MVKTKKRGGGRQRGRTSFTLTISVKAMMTDVLHLSYEAHERLMAAANKRSF